MVLPAGGWRKPVVCEFHLVNANFVRQRWLLANSYSRAPVLCGSVIENGQSSLSMSRIVPSARACLAKGPHGGTPSLNTDL